MYIFMFFYSDEGNIGTFELVGDAIHDMDFKLDSHLNLNVYREDANGIIGRGVKVRLTFISTYLFWPEIHVFKRKRGQGESNSNVITWNLCFAKSVILGAYWSYKYNVLSKSKY